MKSGIISLLIFTLIGPAVGFLIMSSRAENELTGSLGIVVAYVFGGPLAFLAGVVFISILGTVANALNLSRVRYGYGALIGAGSGLLAAAISQFLPVHTDEYLVCGIVAAVCGAIRCMHPIKVDSPSRNNSPEY